ncbi:hypothetical protein NKJ59_21735 [Mesorhizobium australicum]|uniref:hypothetical protein n=1 Tax=Mesorhizobium australicum TaxID=536018 RepID=UPI00333BE074
MIRIVAALGLGAASTALALANLTLYDTPVDISPTKASAQHNVRQLQQAAAGAPAASGNNSFAETFERPLFTPTRRKFIPAADGARPVQPASDALPQPVPGAGPTAAPSLLGVSLGGANARALFKVAGAEKANWYGSGETVDGWTVSRVETDAATLERDGKSKRLLLYPPRQPAPATSPGGSGGL